jgi:undecaprenyl diphosphate synthase
MTNVLNDIRNLPQHIGIIMDGNGRWAEQRGLIRTQGHLEGLSAAKRIIKAASDLGIRYVTLYTFSTENWKRPETEVSFIMDLVKRYLKAEFDFYRENKIRIRHAGDVAGLPPDIADELAEAIRDTEEFDGMQVILALNYGGRDEIIRAIRKLARNDDFAAGGDDTGFQNISEEDIDSNMDNADVPDPDLIIRTAGEYRTSNFLIWEAAYAEWYFSEKLWPDWQREDLEKALENYQGRNRRFGGVPADGSGDK